MGRGCGLVHKEYLESGTILGCCHCRTHLTTKDDIISSSFHGQTGRAYLFGNVVNIVESDAQERELTTGLHVVRDIYCRGCSRALGWKYDKAFEESQKYKEGKFILEKALIVELDSSRPSSQSSSSE